MIAAADSVTFPTLARSSSSTSETNPAALASAPVIQVSADLSPRTFSSGIPVRFV